MCVYLYMSGDFNARDTLCKFPDSTTMPLTISGESVIQNCLFSQLALLYYYTTICACLASQDPCNFTLRGVNFAILTER